jgi:hypothetical protein
MKRIVLVGLLALPLAIPAVSTAGGWATVQLSSTPTGLHAQSVWDVRVTVLQHGRTPLAGVKPRLTIRRGALTRAFRAVPTAAEGVYRTKVVFPTAGVWRYAVWDGFTEYGGAREHTYAPVRIAPR